MSEPNQPIIASIETPLIKPENQSSSLVSKNLEPLASHTRVDSPVISVIQETKINSDGTDTNKKKEGKKSSQASSNPNASNGKKKNKNTNQNSLFTTNKEDSSLSKQAKQPKR